LWAFQGDRRSYNFSLRLLVELRCGHSKEIVVVHHLVGLYVSWLLPSPKHDWDAQLVLNGGDLRI
jgi:hypothetical protein